MCGARDDDKDFNLGANNDHPRGTWSDGTTMWVADSDDAKIYAYVLDDGARDDDKDFNSLTDAGNDGPWGIWSDGTTMWVADTSDNKLYAYVLSDGARDSDRDFDTLDVAENEAPRGIWSDKTTMWVADSDDDKVYAYNMPSSHDATLSALSVSPKDIIGFDSSRTDYEVGVGPTIEQATVTAAASDSRAMVEFSTTDADGATEGHQKDLSAGRNRVTITVTALDGMTTQNYRVSVNRGVTDTTGWQAGADLDGLIAAENDIATGIWSDGTTMWVADIGDDKLYANALSGGARDTGNDIVLGANNGDPRGIWSDETTMWVADTGDNKLYAYVLSGGARDAGKDINLGANNDHPRGTWSDGTTMWVADDDDDKLYAYQLSGGSRDAGKDIALVNANGDPRKLAGKWAEPGERLYSRDQA